MGPDSPQDRRGGWTRKGVIVRCGGRTMSRTIWEPDWRLFRQLHSVALERFCERVISQLQSHASDTRKNWHQRYLAIYNHIHDKNEEMAQAFDNPRRSSAFLQLAVIQRHGLLTPDEFARFSDETRQVVAVFLGADDT